MESFRALTPHAIVDDLNPAQQQVVTHGLGPQLVVAGAGTGKTTVITRRIAYLVATKVCAARDILALTFTDKAAEEMESRVDVLVPYGFNDSTICTFHAFGDQVLRENGILLGMNPDYKILSTPEQLIFLREHLFELPLQILRPLSDPVRHLQQLLALFSRAKDEDVTPAMYLKYCEESESHWRGESKPAECAAWEKQHEVAQAYAKYQELLMRHGLVDFGDLIMLALRLFREHPDRLADYRQRYQHILVDEFQDTNAAQFELIRLLAGEKGNVGVVGDDDQSIYKFRGAAISNILQFKHYYPQAVLHVLNDNYRSTQNILNAAYRLIRHNDPWRLEVQHGLDKRLRAQHNEEKEEMPVRLHSFDTVSEEADWIAEEIVKLHGKHPRATAWKDYAILVRTNRHADSYLRALNVRGIPYRFSGNQDLFRTPEVRLCTAFLRTVADPNAPLPFHELALSWIYSIPSDDMAMLGSASRRKNMTLHQALFKALNENNPELSTKGQETAQKIWDDLQHYLELSRKLTTGQLLYRFLTESGILAHFTHSSTPEADQAIRNIAKFFQYVGRYEHLAPSDRVIYFVAHLDMLEKLGDDSAAENDPEIDAVNLLTVHRSKGLEFRCVFMAGLAANRFPPQHRNPALQFPLELAKEEIFAGDPFIEEERRLAYVAMTRAQDELIFTYAKDYGGSRLYKPSRFILEALETQAEGIKSVSLSALERIHAHAPVEETVINAAPPKTEDETITLSFYQINDYMTCPLKYKYIHILNIPILPSHAIFYGNALHLAINEFYRRKMNNLSVTKDDLNRVFKEAWVNEGYISREHEEMRFAAGTSALNVFYDKESISSIIPKYIEMPFDITLDKNRVIGRMDRVDILQDQKVVITDFKSTEIQDQKEADKKCKESLQLKIYALAWWKITGIIPYSMQMYFIDGGFIGTCQTELAGIMAVEKLIIENAQKIRKKEFSATPNIWICSVCSYRNLCPSAIF